LYWLGRTRADLTAGRANNPEVAELNPAAANRFLFYKGLENATENGTIHHSTVRWNCNMVHRGGRGCADFLYIDAGKSGTRSSTIRRGVQVPPPPFAFFAIHSIRRPSGTRRALPNVILGRSPASHIRYTVTTDTASISATSLIRRSRGGVLVSLII
jgi:hypothetical protein